MKDVEVLFALRHHAIVSRDCKQDQVDPVCPCEHVADETFVTGHIDYTRAGPVRQGQIRKPQIDRNSALFFLFQSIGVLARQSTDQGRLAVIYMTGGADYRAGDRCSHFDQPYPRASEMPKRAGTSASLLWCKS